MYTEISFRDHNGKLRTHYQCMKCQALLRSTKSRDHHTNRFVASLTNPTPINEIAVELQEYLVVGG